MNNVTADSEDPFSLDNASCSANNSEPKLDTSETDSKDTLMCHKALVGNQKRHTSLHALWFFPKPKLPSGETEEWSSVTNSNRASCNRAHASGIIRSNKENAIIRRTLSFPVKASTTAKGISMQESSDADDDALISRYTASTPPVPEAENTHLSAQLDVWSPCQSAVSDKPSSAQLSTSACILTDPISAFSVRTIKAYSAMPQLIFPSGHQTRPLSFPSTQQHRASFADFKALVNTSAGSSCRSARGLVQPFFDWKKASSDSMTLGEIAEVNVSKTVDVAFNSPAAQISGGESSLHTQQTPERSAGEYMLPESIE